eukprot:3061808-Prymnesium_polylepis.1
MTTTVCLTISSFATCTFTVCLHLPNARGSSTAWTCLIASLAAQSDDSRISAFSLHRANARQVPHTVNSRPRAARRSVRRIVKVSFFVLRMRWAAVHQRLSQREARQLKAGASTSRSRSRSSNRTSFASRHRSQPAVSALFFRRATVTTMTSRVYLLESAIDNQPPNARARSRCCKRSTTRSIARACSLICCVRCTTARHERTAMATWRLMKDLSTNFTRSSACARRSIVARQLAHARETLPCSMWPKARPTE